LPVIPTPPWQETPKRSEGLGTRAASRSEKDSPEQEWVVGCGSIVGTFFLIGLISLCWKTIVLGKKHGNGDSSTSFLSHVMIWTHPTETTRVDVLWDCKVPIELMVWKWINVLASQV